ncbi:MAG: 2-C-methyl-D-erythritol 2,4-cyclodiphosphate synthase [Lentisphaerae bacterium]|nr:2-C-methyl-D-erythritol 2,4-cyclodiphosphate synthase [Lentisphaerota bacterium]
MVRTGLGYDVHRLVMGRKLILCGVEVPHLLGLLGHSDADVATHALIDALLGAMAMGDIGKLFPDTDEKWKDANSVDLLKDVVSRLHRTGHGVVNVDVTIMCEAPKLADYIDAMREKLAAALVVDKKFVSVKATTMERLGAVGRGEGIAAMAIASVRN